MPSIGVPSVDAQVMTSRDARRKSFSWSPSVVSRFGAKDAIGRPGRVTVGAFVVHGFLDGLVGEGEHVDVGGVGRAEVRVAGGAEGDAPAVGRPVEAGDGVAVALGEPYWLRRLRRAGGRD